MSKTRSLRSKGYEDEEKEKVQSQKPVWVKLTGMGGGAWWPGKMESSSAVFFWSDNSRMKVKKECIKPFEISSLVKFTRDKLKKAGSDSMREDFEFDFSKATAMLQEDKLSGSADLLYPLSVGSGETTTDCQSYEKVQNPNQSNEDVISLHSASNSNEITGSSNDVDPKISDLLTKSDSMTSHEKLGDLVDTGVIEMMSTSSVVIGEDSSVQDNTVISTDITHSDCPLVEQGDSVCECSNFKESHFKQPDFMESSELKVSNTEQTESSEIFIPVPNNESKDEDITDQTLVSSETSVDPCESLFLNMPDENSVTTEDNVLSETKNEFPVSDNVTTETIEDIPEDMSIENNSAALSPIANHLRNNLSESHKYLTSSPLTTSGEGSRLDSSVDTDDAVVGQNAKADSDSMGIVSPSSSYVKCMKEEAMDDNMKMEDNSSDGHSVGKSECSHSTGGHESGDEVDTTSHIEIISTPTSNGEDYKSIELSPVKTALQKTTRRNENYHTRRRNDSHDSQSSSSLSRGKQISPGKETDSSEDGVEMKITSEEAKSPLGRSQSTLLPLQYTFLQQQNLLLKQHSQQIGDEEHWISDMSEYISDSSENYSLKDSLFEVHSSDFEDSSDSELEIIDKKTKQNPITTQIDIFSNTVSTTKDSSNSATNPTDKLNPIKTPPDNANVMNVDSTSAESLEPVATLVKNVNAVATSADNFNVITSSSELNPVLGPNDNFKSVAAPPENFNSGNHDHDTPDEEEIIRDKDFPKIYCRKTLHSSDSKSGKEKKSRRVFNNYHCCFVCGNIKSNIRKHLFVHKDNSDIKLLLKMKDDPERCEEAGCFQTYLRNKGDHQHNQKVLENRAGELIVSRRQDSFSHKQYGPCSSCLEWLKMDVSFAKHKQCCVQAKKGEKTKIGDAIIKSEMLKGSISLEASKKLVSDVFPIMRRDEIAKIAKSDKLIVGLGNYWLRQNIGNKLKRKNYTSSRMRSTARLVKNLQSNCTQQGEEKTISLYDFLIPAKFDLIANSAMQCATIDADDEEDLLHPTAAIKIGFDLLRLANLKIGEAMRGKSDENLRKEVREKYAKEREDAEDFLRLMKMEWSNKVTRIANKILRERRMAKVSENPTPEDLQTMAEHLGEKIRNISLKLEDASPTHVKELQTYVLSKLLLYNKRRSGELEQMLLTNYHNRSKGLNEFDQTLGADLTETEKLLLGQQEIIQIQGKADNIVPVLVPIEVIKPLAYLADPQVRVKAGIKSDNMYLFANTGNGVHRAYDSLKCVCEEAGVRYPDRITSVNIRKYFATMMQVIGMQPHELEHLCKHMGHSFNVHMQHYRGASGYIERFNIGKLMLMQDFNVVSKFKGKRIEDINIEDIMKQKMTEKDVDNKDAMDNADEQMGVMNAFGDDIDSDDGTVSFRSGKGNKTKYSKVTRVPWTPEEEEEIQSFFQSYLNHTSKRKCPGQKEIAEIVKKSKHLKRRQWETIKKKVSHMMKKTLLV